MSESLAFDPGTGLPRLRHAIADFARWRQEENDPEKCHGLVVLDIKPSAALLRLSTEAGELLRQEVSWRLADVLRPNDRLYVLGQWEWLVLLFSLPSPASVSLAMLRLNHTLQPPLQELGSEGFLLQPVCGGAVCPDHGGDPQHLVQSARIAALHASEQEEWSALYRPDMEQRSSERADLSRRLQSALLGGDLQLFLQPQIDLADCRCRSAEALLRWKHPNGQWVDPVVAVELLEQAGMRPDFNRWLFQRAALYLSQLREKKQEIRISINLTARDLLDPEVPDLLEQALATWSLPPGSLTLEITETTAVRESREVEDILRRLGAMQAQLSIDDFGTGYAGMAYLQHLPVQEIKVDKRFIRNLAQSTRDREITASIIELAHKLGMHVVAEGVESIEAKKCLEDMGCERIQGHLYSPALPMEAFLRWVSCGRQFVPRSPADGDSPRGGAG
ncbi:MAG: bifunctional diguanylate cyclase/phosphodiesterase [Zoogloeaceae bacterium]|nr:bifunctional diguanylate cyclase/phosphodiesterase [Zoogloeaceae bacterium]